MSRFGNLIGGKKNPAPVVEPVAVPTPPTEETRPDLGEDTTNYEKIIEEELVETFPYESDVSFHDMIKKELEEYESDVSFHDMTKKELEEYGRTVGIELDRRHSKKRLVQELEEYLSDS